MEGMLYEPSAESHFDGSPERPRQGGFLGKGQPLRMWHMVSAVYMLAIKQCTFVKSTAKYDLISDTR